MFDANTQKDISITVDVFSKTNLCKDGKYRFTQENVDVTRQLVIPLAYPEYFGDGIPDGLELDGDEPIRLVDDSLINWMIAHGNYTQNSRAAGKNPKYKDVQKDISNYGFKLRNVPILVKRNPDGTYTPINGRTRAEILRNFGFVNFICIVYKPKKGKSDLQIRDAISNFCLRSNAENDPAGDLLLEDVFIEGCYAIDQGFIKLTGAMYQDIEIIRKRVDEVCGQGTFTDTKRSYVAFRIYNNYTTGSRVLSWSVKGSPDEWVKSSKFKNIAPTLDAKGNVIKIGLMYIIVSSETLDKSLMRAITTAYANKNYRIRVIVHTGTLKGFDTEENYAEKIFNFRSLWELTLDKMSYAYFKSVDPSNLKIELYGALPAVEILHDLSKLQKFVDYDSTDWDDLKLSVQNGTRDWTDGLESV